VVSYETRRTNEKVFPIHTSSILHGVLGGCPFTLAAGFQFMGIIIIKFNNNNNNNNNKINKINILICNNI
jgi:hypothetical protein